jgi:hypothetical protein
MPESPYPDRTLGYGNLYLFCYGYGFMKQQENGKSKYVLVQWQPYMK